MELNKHIHILYTYIASPQRPAPPTLAFLAFLVFLPHT